MLEGRPARMALALSIAIAALAAPAHASHGEGGGPGDWVRGAGENIFNTRFWINVHTHPRSDELRGRFAFEVPGLPPPFVNDATPTCLRAEGHRATLGGKLRRPVETPAGSVGAVLVTITDGRGSVPDGVTFNAVPTPPTSCPPPTIPDDALTRGDVVVHDGEPPPP
jgi:hypothetical protein